MTASAGTVRAPARVVTPLLLAWPRIHASSASSISRRPTCSTARRVRGAARTHGRHVGGPRRTWRLRRRTRLPHRAVRALPRPPRRCPRRSPPASPVARACGKHRPRRPLQRCPWRMARLPPCRPRASSFWRRRCAHVRRWAAGGHHGQSSACRRGGVTRASRCMGPCMGPCLGCRARRGLPTRAMVSAVVSAVSERRFALASRRRGAPP